jgi:hypothetical protein
MSYLTEAMENLAKTVDLRNRGIKYIPKLNDANTAQIWFNRKFEQPQTEEAE